MKLKRPQTVKQFRAMIDELYAEVASQDKSVAKL